MAILFITLFFALSVYGLFALVRRLCRQRANVGLWVAFAILAAGGVTAGIWCAFYFEYHVGTHYRIGSFPIPVVFFHLEDGQWVDFPVPGFQASAAALTNLITITATTTLPVWLLSWWQHRRDHMT